MCQPLSVRLCQWFQKQWGNEAQYICAWSETIKKNLIRRDVWPQIWLGVGASRWDKGQLLNTTVQFCRKYMMGEELGRGQGGRGGGMGWGAQEVLRLSVLLCMQRHVDIQGRQHLPCPFFRVWGTLSSREESSCSSWPMSGYMQGWGGL